MCGIKPARKDWCLCYQHVKVGSLKSEANLLHVTMILLFILYRYLKQFVLLEILNCPSQIKSLSNKKYELPLNEIMMTRCWFALRSTYILQDEVFYAWHPLMWNTEVRPQILATSFVFLSTICGERLSGRADYIMRSPRKTSHQIIITSSKKPRDIFVFKNILYLQFPSSSSKQVLNSFRKIQ